MTQHSSLVGGSTADRLLNCPGSYRAILSLPPQPDVQSAAAAEGTHCHHVMDALMQARMADNSTNLYEEAEVWLGDTFYDRELTQQTLEELIWPAIDAVEKLEIEYGRGFKVVGVEQVCEFPGVPTAFGTIDLVLQSATHVIVVDYKFGAVDVPAVYTDDDGGERLNPQLIYYACAARHTRPGWFSKRRDIITAIIQPRCDPVLRHTHIFTTELDMFAEDIVNAVSKALTRDPDLKRGDWCKWCPAKPVCPEWLKPMIEYAAMSKVRDVEVPSSVNVSALPTPYSERLARAKELSEMVKAFAEEVDRQMEIYLTAGGVIPGWVLEPRKKQRKWVDPAVVVPELIKLGFKDDEIWKHELQTFQVTDAAAKKRGKTIPAHLRATPPSDEMKIVRSSEHKPFVDSGNVLEQLRASVALIDRDAKGKDANG